jgi:Ycf4
MHTDLIRRYSVVGSRRVSNYIWAFISGLGGLDFLLTGLSSYLNYNILPIIHAENIIFFPQGLVMCFYGLLGFFFSFYLSLTILWSVGGGFNIFDKQKEIVRIFRWGFPGKNRRIDLTYSINDVTGIRLELKDGLNPRRTIYLCVKGQRQIPLTRVGQPMTLEEIETLAAELAQFLQKDLLN